MLGLDFNDNHRTPAFKVVITTKDNKQQDITQVVSSRLINLSLTDNRGLEADTLDLELSDHDGKLALPPRNATISLALGWKGAPLIGNIQSMKCSFQAVHRLLISSLFGQEQQI